MSGKFYPIDFMLILTDWSVMISDTAYHKKNTVQLVHIILLFIRCHYLYFWTSTRQLHDLLVPGGYYPIISYLLTTPYYSQTELYSLLRCTVPIPWCKILFFNCTCTVLSNIYAISILRPFHQTWCNLILHHLKFLQILF